MTYLPSGLPIPVPMDDGLDTPFWEGTRKGQLLVQQCERCGTWVWGPEWICHNCHSFDLEWKSVEPSGRIYSWERVWHPVHPAVAQSVPYIIVSVEIDAAPGVRMVGNLLGDPLQEVEIGAPVVGKFEPHEDVDPPFTLVQWQLKE